ncbi:hypothetical protein FYK55_27335 [Roseiconus nitratireducens]|uniref:ParB/Sulfiredoxin domain-containing protein n=1 Tax=Roseiconus nitratireducens TaxID=2605748 RepID=A0A5M6CU76_9BACT|nr:hypothetical protein FYK55_27335 [Roseiconus nitratireducens]
MNCIFDDSPLDEATVQSYERRFRAGEKLPAIVIWGDGQQRSILDGRHRVEAAKRCGFDRMSCYYELCCPIENAVHLRRMLNGEDSVQDVLNSALGNRPINDQVIANPPYGISGTQRDT